MTRVVINLTEREMSEARAAKDGRPWRTIFLEALGVEEAPRAVGKPSL